MPTRITVPLGSDLAEIGGTSASSTSPPRAPAAVAEGEEQADAAPAVFRTLTGTSRVVWLSIDPRNGTVHLYPDAAVKRLERAHAQGMGISVPLAGLGGHLEHAVVDVGIHGPPVQRNPMTHGKRDVRRMEVPVEATEVTVSVSQERGYRISDVSIPGVTEERIVSLSSFAGSRVLSAEEKEQARQDRAKEIADAQAPGTVGLWEWCRETRSDNLAALPASMWGVYSQAQNEEIESAFLKGDLGVTVTIGIRSYNIVFEGLQMGRQIDAQHKKKRHIRRRAMTNEEREQTLREALQALGAPLDADAECAICCTPFAETPSVPVVRLDCGHSFHGACVQCQADRRSTCPLCRAEVDWGRAMALSK